MNIKIPDISKLHVEKKILEKAKREIFEIVLNKCVADINYTNKYTDKTFILFEVPKVIIGYSHYDKNACIEYLIDVFKSENYFAASSNGYVYIDWSKQKEINKPSLNKHTLNLLKKKYPNASKVVVEYQ